MYKRGRLCGGLLRAEGGGCGADCPAFGGEVVSEKGVLFELVELSEAVMGSVAKINDVDDC